MQFSYKWLQEYFEEDLPDIKDLVETLIFHAFEIDGVEGDLIDIDVLPNRSHDCFCYQGIVKEISVLTGLKLKEINKSYKAEQGLKSSDFLSLTVENSKLIPRATKRLVQAVKIGPSPLWLKERLESIGQKSINNVVDITNYVMWETGQPVHAFDFDKLVSNQDGIKKFVIRSAKKGEKIITLDNHEFELDEDILVISDGETALDIAGTKGGIISGIDEKTKNIVLSICNFNQVSIRRTSKKLNLRTDASVRFENGISPDKVGEAMERLSQLISQITGGKVAEDILDVYPRPANQYKVGISTQDANRLLGLNFSDKEIENILQRLDFNFEKVKPIDNVLEMASNLINIPYKSGASVVYDAPNLFDCSSLTAYLFAQAGISIPRVSVDQFVFGEKIEKDDLRRGDLVFANTGLIKETGIYTETFEFLPGTKVPEGIDHVGLYLGKNEILYTSSETSKVVIEKLNEAKTFKNIVGYRRVSDDPDPNLTDGQRRYVVTIPHERLDLRIKEDLIEEIGRVYGYKNIESQVVNPNPTDGQGKVFEPKLNKVFYYINKIKNILVEAGFDEVYTYTFEDKGVVEVQKPLASNLAFLRTNLTDGIQKSLKLNSKNAPLLGLDEIKIFEIGKVFSSINDEYTALTLGVFSLGKKKKEIVENEILTNVLEKLSQELNVNINKSTGNIFEINLDKLIEGLPEPDSYEDVLKSDSKEIIIFKKISSYPFMLRDIAVFIPNENSSEDLLKVIKDNAGDLLVQTKLFDTYSPEGGNKTSYAFNLVFQSQEKTLTDEEINKIMDKITEVVSSKGWEVR